MYIEMTLIIIIIRIFYIYTYIYISHFSRSHFLSCPSSNLWSCKALHDHRMRCFNSHCQSKREILPSWKRRCQRMSKATSSWEGGSWEAWGQTFSLPHEILPSHFSRSHFLSCPSSNLWSCKALHDHRMRCFNSHCQSKREILPSWKRRCQRMSKATSNTRILHCKF